MRGARWAIVATCVACTSCTQHNPRACANGLCTDPSYPFCDVDGSLSGMADTCISVSCTPMQFIACRGNVSLTCNATGDNYDATQCQNMCDPNVGCTAPRVMYIVFGSNRDGNNEIYRINPDGTMPTNLTSNAASDFSPLWDPTGQLIAFLSDRAAPQQLFVMKPDGTNVVNVSNGPAQDMSWSNDGTQLAFTSNRTGHLEIFKATASGGTPSQLTSLGVDTTGEPSWSPDGTKLAFVSNGRIYVMNSDGTSPTPLTTGTDAFPSWKPDSTKIAFARRITFSNFDVFVMNPDGSAATNITNTTSADEAGPGRWSPDGTAVAGTGGADPDTEVFIVDSTGSMYRDVSMSPSSRDANPCWSPDGMSLVYDSNRSGNSDLYLVSRTGGTSINLTMSAGFDGGCVWRPR